MNIRELYDLKINMGFLDLRKYKTLISEIKNLPNEYLLDLKEVREKIKQEIENIDISDNTSNEFINSYAQILMNLHSKFGNNLNQMEFKLNQAKIQARINSLKNPNRDSLNGDIDFCDVDKSILDLLNSNYKLSKIMKNLIYVDISSENMEILSQIDNSIKQINKLVYDDFNSIN